MSGVVPTTDWARAKDEYKAITGVKKPREKFAKLFDTGHTGLTKSIREVYDYGQPSPKPKSPEKYKQLLDAYKKASETYIVTLNKCIDEESEKTAKEWVVGTDKVDIKKIKTDMYRGLKMLKAKLENYQTQFELQYKMAVQASSALSKVEKLEQQFEVMLKNGLKRFANASQTIKAMPTLEIYNREFGQDAVRTLTTALKTYKMIAQELTKQNIQLSDKQTRLNTVSAHWVTQLSPWADGAKKQLTGPLSKDQVLAELKAASAQVKACAAAFGLSV